MILDGYDKTVYNGHDFHPLYKTTQRYINHKWTNLY